MSMIFAFIILLLSYDVNTLDVAENYSLPVVGTPDALFDYVDNFEEEHIACYCNECCEDNDPFHYSVSVVPGLEYVIGSGLITYMFFRGEEINFNIFSVEF